MIKTDYLDTLIGPPDFLRIFAKTCRVGTDESTLEGFSSFLRQQIFPELGKVSAELYYADGEHNFSPYPSPLPTSHQISGRHVPFLIPGKDPLLAECLSRRCHLGFHEEQETAAFLRSTGNVSHLFFPVCHGQKVTALLYLGCRQHLVFPKEYLLGIEALTVFIGSRMKSLKTISHLKTSMAEAAYSEQLQQALYEISEQAHLVANEQELYASLHKIVGRLINAGNFFIALRENHNGENYFRFAYYFDEFDSHFQGMEFKIDPKEKFSMTGYLLQSGEPILLGPDTFDKVCQENNINPLGKKAYSLVGVPFTTDHLAGVVLVQNYHEELYTEKDKDLMVYVARHLGDALRRWKTIDDMRASERRYRIIFEKSPMAVVCFDTAGTVVDCNEKFVALMGSTREQLIGFSSAHRSSRKMQEIIKKALSGEIAFFEGSYTSITGGRTAYLRGIFSPVVPGQSPTEVIATLEDITELKKHEKEQQKIEKLESLGVLAGGIAHDFNNVLTGILANISFSQVLIDPSHRAARPLAEAEKASKRAAELAQQLLTFAKGGEPNKKIISVQRLIHEAVSLMLRGSNVRAIFKVADGLDPIQADEGQISQALNNLIINAAQAMPGGGTLTITAKNEALPAGNRFGLTAGTYIKIKLRDEGCGISQEILGKIFDPYFSTKISGTGLGLASAYSILHRHHGSIRADSRINLGTTFTILLPSIPPSSAEAVPEIPIPPAVHNGGAILVMDDEEMIRNIAATMLTHLGYQVTTCASGEETINLYIAAMERGNPFVAVIMDLTIPGGLGGRKTAEKILSLFPQANLIVSSGYSNDPIIAHYQRYGFRGAIAKPYSIDEINQVLSDLMAKQCN